MRITGLEPAHRLILDPKSNASANSAISAYGTHFEVRPDFLGIITDLSFNFKYKIYERKILLKTFVKSLALLLVFIFTFSFLTVFASAAVRIDGDISTKEWADAQEFNLINSKSESLNNIDLVRAKALKADAYTIYLAVSATNTTDVNIDDCAVRLNIMGAGTYNFGVDNSSDFSANDIVDIEYGATGDAADSFFFEFKLTFKSEVADDIQIKLSFRDAEGVLSRESVVSGIKSSSAETPTTQQIKTTKPTNEKTTKYKNTTKFSDDKESTDATEKETTEQVSISTVGKNENSTGNIIRIVMTVFAVVLIIVAAAILLFARLDKKKTDTKEKE